MKESVFAVGVFLVALFFVVVAPVFNGGLTGKAVDSNKITLSWDNPCPSSGTQYRILKTGFAGWWQDKITEQSVSDKIDSPTSYQFFASCLKNGNQGPFLLITSWTSVNPEDGGVKLFSSGDVSKTDVLSAVDSCVSNCDGRVCGDDGCGGSCGTCSSGEVCSISGVCSNLYKEGYFESKCELCGKGFFNICDEKECSSLGNCVFSSSFLSRKCDKA